MKVFAGKNHAPTVKCTMHAFMPQISAAASLMVSVASNERMDWNVCNRIFGLDTHGVLQDV